MIQAIPALLILGLRASCVLFLLAYPLSTFLWRLFTKPWVTQPLKEGLSYLLQPLALLEAKRLYSEAIAELGPPPAPRFDINEASFAQLCELEGVGATRAHEILAYREEYGRFRRMEELGLIKGVGVKTFKLLCERFEVPEEEARKRSPQLSHQLLSAQLIQAIPPSIPPSISSLPALEPQELPLVDNELELDLKPKLELEPQALELNDSGSEQRDV